MLVSLVVALALSAPVMDSAPSASAPPPAAPPATQAPAAARLAEPPMAPSPETPPAVVPPAPPSPSSAPPVAPVVGTRAEVPPALAPRRTPPLPADSFNLALGLGVATASGNASARMPMSDLTAEQVDMLVELGARFAERFYLGGYFEIGEGDTSGATGDCKSCSVRRAALGLDAKYAFAPRGRFNPWIGIGGGIEGMSLDLAYQSPSTSRTSFTVLNYRGWELPRLSAGVDWRLNRIIGVGLFARFSFARYTRVRGLLAETESASGEHTWFTVGARGILFP